MTNIKMVCWPYGPKYSSDAGRRRLYKSSAGIGSYWRNIFALGGHPCVHFDGTLGYANQCVTELIGGAFLFGYLAGEGQYTANKVF